MGNCGPSEKKNYYHHENYNLFDINNNNIKNITPGNYQKATNINNNKNNFKNITPGKYQKIKNINNNKNNFKIKNPDDYQQSLYIKILSEDVKSQPVYTNLLNINNANISKNNKFILSKLSKIANYSLITPLEIIYKEQYGMFSTNSKEREKCPICLLEFYDDIIEDNPKDLDLKPINEYTSHEIDVIKLNKCEDHFYHIECLSNYIQNEKGFKCAICQKQYGIIVGNMPFGKMKARINKNLKCDGYYDCNTIVIEYDFNNGIQNGRKYTGTKRICYLPNNKEGREILGMLKIAFDRKLTFVVGTSITTGKKNVVVYNGIHHKTSTNGGPTNYGYPDPSYFKRVIEELASKGINKNDFEDDKLELIANNLLFS